MSEQQAAGMPPEEVSAEGAAADAAQKSGAGEADAALEASKPTRPLFTADERAQFDADDVTAGSHIGKMLALFFLYTVLAMSVVAWWTMSVAD